MRITYKTAFILFLCLELFGTSVVFGQEVGFYRNLSVGASGPDVMLLQKILNQDNDTQVALEGAGSFGFETDYFGSKTKEAVIKYQQKYRTEILMPLGLQYGTGMVGLQTRNKLNSRQLNIPVSISAIPAVDISVSNVSAKTKPKPPVIKSISPTEVSDPRNLPVIIKGDNFSAKNKVLVGINQYEEFEAPSADGQTIKVFLDIELIDGMVRLMNSIPKTEGGNEIERARASIKKELGLKNKDGVYVPAVVVVENENGRSDKVMIHINVLSDDQEF